MPKVAAPAVVEYPDSLVPYRNNARTHSNKQIKAIAASIECFGFTNSVLATRENEILAGHGRVRAAQLLGLASVPVLRIDHLSEAERRPYSRRRKSGMGPGDPLWLFGAKGDPRHRSSFEDVAERREAERTPPREEEPGGIEWRRPRPCRRGGEPRGGGP